MLANITLFRYAVSYPPITYRRLYYTKASKPYLLEGREPTRCHDTPRDVELVPEEEEVGALGTIGDINAKNRLTINATISINVMRRDDVGIFTDK